MLKIAVHHHLTDVLIPKHLGCTFRKIRVISTVPTDTVNAEQHIVCHIIVRVIISRTLIGIPSGIAVTRLPCKEVCERRILSARNVQTLAHVTKPGTQR